MKKKMVKAITSALLAGMMIAPGMNAMAATETAFAEANAFEIFQPYTDVDLSILEKAGYSASYDNWKFSAELTPQNAEIEYSDGLDTCSMKMDIKIVYGAGSALLVPRFIFKRNGMWTYFDDRMSEAYIINGENRYEIELSGVSRSTDSKNSTASESVVEPLRTRGCYMLKDLATNPCGISVCLGSSMSSFTLTASEEKAIAEFYNTCNEAGVFDQDELSDYKDDYLILTQFNEGATAEEDIVEAETEE